MKVKLIGKISGKYNGFDYYKLLFVRNLSKENNKNLIVDGEDVYNPLKYSTTPYIKAISSVFNALQVGDLVDTDTMAFDLKQRLISCDY